MVEALHSDPPLDSVLRDRDVRHPPVAAHLLVIVVVNVTQSDPSVAIFKFHLEVSFMMPVSDF